MPPTFKRDIASSGGRSLCKVSLYIGKTYRSEAPDLEQLCRDDMEGNEPVEIVWRRWLSSSEWLWVRELGKRYIEDAITLEQRIFEERRH